jgi:hypothetical protein
MEQLPSALHLRVGSVLYLEPHRAKGIGVCLPLGHDPLEMQPFRRSEEIAARPSTANARESTVLVAGMIRSRARFPPPAPPAHEPGLS